MKGGKDDEKITGPLFPRLRVNDTEKAGPRAPPRNKMALYEQLSIPSQRFNSFLASTLPLPSHNADTLVPSKSSSQGGGHQGSVFSPSYVPPPTTAHSTEKLHSSSMNVSMPVFEWKSMKNANYQTLDVGHMLSTPECSSFHLNSKNPVEKELGDEDDLRVPAFVHPEVASCPNKDLPSMDRERFASFCPSNQGCHTVTPVNSPLKPAATSCNLLMQPQNGHNKHSKRTSTTDLRLRLHIGDQNEENPKSYVTSRESAEVPASHQPTRVKVAKPLTHTDGSANLAHQSNLLDDFGRVCDSGRLVQQEYRVGLVQGSIAHVDGISVEPVGLKKGDITGVRSQPCSIVTPGHSCRGLDQTGNGTEYHEDNACGSLQMGDVDKNDDESEISMVDSMSGLEGISPDDVVGVIGQKRFWKARRAIVNQQRLFAVQVFELHRLIKVQKLIAGAPHLLLENNHHLAKPSVTVSPTKKMLSDYVLKSPQWNVKQIGDSQKPNQSTECAAENAVGKATLPSLDSGINKVPVGQHSNCGPYSRNPPAAPMGADSNMGPWGFHPPSGNQWLVPVLSPSEGLIYKPYTAPSPHPPGFMAPVYGGCEPLSLPPVARDFMNHAYGIQATHQGMGVVPSASPVGLNYFPPYGFPFMSSVMSASAVEQASLLAGARPRAQAEQLSTGEVNFNMHQQSSCNYSIHKSEAIDRGIWKFQASKDGELHGSTASSPCERAQGAGPGHVDERDPLLLFPMAPAVQVSDRNHQAPGSNQQIRAIKVAPHNPRSASESAARIFRSIQKERQQYDSV